MCGGNADCSCAPKTSCYDPCYDPCYDCYWPSWRYRYGCYDSCYYPSYCGPCARPYTTYEPVTTSVPVTRTYTTYETKTEWVPRTRWTYC